MDGLNRRIKATILVTMLLATILNYLDRQTIGILAPVLQQKMSIDNEHLGWLFAIFYYSYTLFQFVVGPVLDRFNLRICFAIAVTSWSLVSGFTGVALGFASLLAFRFALGLTEAANWPAGMRVVARVLPPEERTLGSGVFESGAGVGALIAPAIIFMLLGRFGWRPVFFCLGTIGLLWAPLWLHVTRGKELANVWVGAQSGRTRSGDLLKVYREFISSPRFWCVVVVSITVNPSFYFTMNWLPTYFVQARHFVPGAKLGGMLTLIYLAVDIGNIGGGVTTLWLSKRYSLETSRRVVFLTATALVTACIAVPFIATAWGAVLAMIAVNMGLGAWNSMFLTLAQEVSSAEVSTAVGTLSAFGSLAGALAMWAVGKLTNSAADFTIPMFSLAGAVALAAVAGWASSRTNANAGTLDGVA
jgi:MFS transporter, ACS family, hexuronate transporter